MRRPKIDRLFDSTVRVWRPTADSNNRLGVEERTYTPIASLGAAFNRSTAPVGDVGPGVMPIGSRRFYLRPDANVQARDVLEIIAGPETGTTWEVDEPPTIPRSHHTQVDSIVWNGILPAVSAS